MAYVKRRDYLRNLGVDGKIVLNILKTLCEDVDWIELAEDEVQWRALESLMNIRIP
jgi:hypothetical protein